MNRLGSLAQIKQTIDDCRAQCRQQDIPFYADGLAAALGIPYDRLARYAAGEGASVTTAALLSGALQECTASVLAYALRADQKHLPFYMWYLRNRAGFFDKDADTPRQGGGVTFVGEERI